MSTMDILKYLISDDIVKEFLNSDTFKNSLTNFDINDYMTDEVVEDISEKIFANPVFKKKLRDMIIRILADMNIKDEVG